MDLRDKIAYAAEEWLYGYGQPSQHDIADQVLEMIKGNVPDLVFEERRNNYWGHKSHGYQVAWNNGNLWRVRLGDRVILKKIKGHPAAVRWANAHHKSALLKSMGLGE